MFSLLFLVRTFESMQNQKQAKKVLELQNKLSDIISDEDLKNSLYEQLLKENIFILSDLIKEYKTIDNNFPMKLKLGFRLQGYDGYYSISFDENSVISEELKYLINDRTGLIFKIDKNKRLLSPSIFSSSYREELLDYIEKYWGKNTLMSIFF